MRLLQNFVFLMVVLSSFMLSAQGGKPDLTGHWHLDVANEILRGPQLDLQLQQLGATITGTAKYSLGGNKLNGPYSIKGTTDGSKVTLTVKGEFRVITNGTDKLVDAVYKGKQVDKNTLQGIVDLPGVGRGTWTAKRK